MDQEFINKIVPDSHKDEPLDKLPKGLKAKVENAWATKADKDTTDTNPSANP